MAPTRLIAGEKQTQSCSAARWPVVTICFPFSCLCFGPQLWGYVPGCLVVSGATERCLLCLSSSLAKALPNRRGFGEEEAGGAGRVLLILEGCGEGECEQPQGCLCRHPGTRWLPGSGMGERVAEPHSPSPGTGGPVGGLPLPAPTEQSSVCGAQHRNSTTQPSPKPHRPKKGPSPCFSGGFMLGMRFPHFMQLKKLGDAAQ